MMDSFANDLQCPLTLELFEDPVTVTCCQRVFSREPLTQALGFRPVCPLCNGDLSAFDPRAAGRNRTVAGLVETYRQTVAHQRRRQQQQHVWEATCAPTGLNDTSELCLSVTEARFATRPSLCVFAVDRSGSMGFRPPSTPFAQVKAALRHVYAVATPSIKIVLIMYDSVAEVIPVAGETVRAKQAVIDALKAQGGTHFRNAFATVGEVLRDHLCSDEPSMRYHPNNVSSATVIFLTDGQDGSGSTETLTADFRAQLHESWEHDVTVHAIGFGSGCNQQLLMSMREAGTHEGTFRYAEPGDNEDALCQKVTGVFELCNQSGTTPVTIRLPDDTVHESNLAITRSRRGRLRLWIKGAPATVRITSQHDDDAVVAVTQTTDDSVQQRWLATRADALATDVIALNGRPVTDLLRLQAALLQQRVDELTPLLEDTATVGFLGQQIEAACAGQKLATNRLNDMRFASLFAPVRDDSAKIIKPARVPATKPLPKALDSEPAFEPELKRRYNRNRSTDVGRNELQKEICACKNATLDVLSPCYTLEDVQHTDEEGNTALMLAAYCGHSATLKAILAAFGPTLDLGQTNDAGECAVSLCIKKRGYHRTLNALLDAGATIPRRRALERFALEHGYTITGRIISLRGDVSHDVDETMKPEYIQFVYERAVAAGAMTPARAGLFLDVTLAKGMVDPLARDLMSKHGARPTIDMLLDRCFPPKPDHPETERYLDLARLLVASDGTLVGQANAKGETPLLIAARKGSLPHVRYFIAQGAAVDAPNAKGNTALWVAAFQCYPCIVTELLDCGADVNRANAKGNPPMYGPCDRGSVKTATLLLQRGASVETINTNGDTLILMCCRNGQHEVLRLLLEYVTPEFVQHKAHIDGFNAIMAAAEANRPQCIRVLAEDGVILNQKTDADNAIVAGGTPLHIAAHYGRTAAFAELLRLGASPALTDAHGGTALHTAAVQGSTDIVKLLRAYPELQRARDNMGNTPLTYCRSNEVMRKLLVDPALDIVSKLARGQFSAEDQAAACELLAQGHTGIRGTSLLASLGDPAGNSVLMTAVAHSVRPVAQALLAAGVDGDRPNSDGLLCTTLAHATRNRRMQALLADCAVDPAQVARIQEDPAACFLRPCVGCAPDPSSIGPRMQVLVNAVTYEATARPQLALTTDAHPLATVAGITDDQLWRARRLTISKVAAGLPPDATASEVLAVAVYTGSPDLAKTINMAIVTQDVAKYPVAGKLYRALSALAPYVGETFLGSADIDRKLFGIGQVFSWSGFTSTSSLWRVAMENTPSFATKSRKGTIFAITGRSGRLVTHWSQHPSDGEVVFLPGSRFRVTNWYHGDVIALGQPNIRAHTFQVKEEDDEWQSMASMADNDKSLIIELQEVERMP